MTSFFKKRLSILELTFVAQKYKGKRGGSRLLHRPLDGCDKCPLVLISWFTVLLKTAELNVPMR